MKKSILLALLLIAVLIAAPAYADTEFSVPHAGGDITLDDNGIVAGVILDAPKLIGLTKNIDLGAEITKTLLNNPFDGKTRAWVDSNDGYTVMAKVTVNTCFFINI